MAIKDIFKVNRKTFFDPRAWLGFDNVKAQTNYLWDLVKPVFARPSAAEPVQRETFEESVKRQNLTESDIKEAGKTYFFYAILFLILAGVTFIFGFYLLILHHSFSGWVISVSVTALFLAQAFRFHFWYFQIKFRKLGCTFAEWKRGKPFDSGESP